MKEDKISNVDIRVFCLETQITSSQDGYKPTTDSQYGT